MRKLREFEAIVFLLFLFTNNSFANILTTPANIQKKSQMKIAAVMKKWRKMKVGMSPNQVKRILGRPKLIQNSSDSSRWYYQCKPKDFNDLNQQGVLVYSAKSLETLIDESRQQRDLKVLSLKKQCELAIQKQNQCCEKKVEKESRKKATYKKVRIKRHYRGVTNTSKKSYYYQGNDKSRYRYKTIQTSKAGKPESQVRKESKEVINDINKRFQKLIKLEFENNERRIKRLREFPRKPEYYLVEFTKPNWSDTESIFDKTILFSKENDPNFPWKNCLSWKGLKVNMSISGVKKVLGKPEKMEINAQEVKFFYGNNPNCGILKFMVNDNNKANLLYWKEPFWLDLTNSNVP